MDCIDAHLLCQGVEWWTVRYIGHGAELGSASASIFLHLHHGIHSGWLRHHPVHNARSTLVWVTKRLQLV